MLQSRSTQMEHSSTYNIYHFTHRQVSSRLARIHGLQSEVDRVKPDWVMGGGEIVWETYRYLRIEGMGEKLSRCLEKLIWISCIPLNSCVDAWIALSSASKAGNKMTLLINGAKMLSLTRHPTTQCRRFHAYHHFSPAADRLKWTPSKVIYETFSLSRQISPESPCLPRGKVSVEIYVKCREKVSWKSQLAWHESVFCLMPPAQSFSERNGNCYVDIMRDSDWDRTLTMFGVILDARYFIPLHWSSVRTGTFTCCRMPGNDPPSEVLPQPTTVPTFPDGSIDSCGRQIGWMPLLNATGLRNRNSAMSWL